MARGFGGDLAGQLPIPGDLLSVILLKMGIQRLRPIWIPTFVGMTVSNGIIAGNRAGSGV